MTRDYRVKRSSLTDQVSDSLERYIRENGLRPGDDLPTEMELTRMFGVSRTVIREGLSAAAALGLIEAETGRRSRVAELSGQALDGFFAQALRLNGDATVELLEVRSALEIFGARRAAEAPDPDDLEGLRSHLQAMEEALAQGRLEAFVDADVEFHLTLTAMSRNEILLHLNRSLRFSTRRSIVSGLKARTADPEIEAIQIVHAEIYEAVRRADPPAAAAAMSQHFDLAIAALRGSGSDET